MKDKCQNCGNEHFENKMVPFTLDKDNKLFKIHNVPAEVCTLCGQKYFSPETYSAVYKLVNNDYRESKPIEAEQMEFA